MVGFNTDAQNDQKTDAENRASCRLFYCPRANHKACPTLVCLLASLNTPVMCVSQERLTHSWVNLTRTVFSNSN